MESLRHHYPWYIFIITLPDIVTTMLPARLIRIAPHVTLKLSPAPCQVTSLSAVGRPATSAMASNDSPDQHPDCGSGLTPSDQTPSAVVQAPEADLPVAEPQPLPVMPGTMQVWYVEADKDVPLPDAFPPCDTLQPDTDPLTSLPSSGLPSVKGPFLLQYCLQSGTFGQAWAAEDQSSGRLMCLKVFRPLDEVGLRHSIRRELRVYRRIASSKEGRRGKPFVMELERSIQHGTVVSFAMELMTTDLCTYMGSQPERCKLHARRWMAQIALGIESLHEMGILHRDIKSENVLVDCRENVRITDFGLAHVEPKSLHQWGEYASEFLGTPQCMAPEVLRNKGLPAHRMKRYGMPVDWWALGCVLFELESWQHQQLFGSEEEVYAYVAWTKRPCHITQIFPKFEGLDPVVVSLLEGLLRISPSFRYSIRELEKHEYFLRRNGTSEFVHTASRALERPVRPELVPQFTDVVDDGLSPLIPRAMLRSVFDWKNPKAEGEMGTII